MSDISWPEALEHVTKYVVRIKTADGGHGSGFLAAKRVPTVPGSAPNQTTVATAYHVVENSIVNNQSFEIQHPASGTVVNIDPDHFDILAKPDRDLALIHCLECDLALPDEPPVLTSAHLRLRPGTDLGWCGFPYVATVGSETLCFFSGHVSALWTEHGDYLVDGVAINGVSGGPAFEKSGGVATIVGLVTMYIPNLVHGRTQPGISVVRSISDVVKLFDDVKADVEKRRAGG